MGIDPDTDNLYYWFDWGDGSNSDWLGPYKSGETITTTYTWESEGTYQVKVKTLDILGAETDYGIESEWSDPLSVSMPRNKININTQLLQFLHNHPLIYQLLQSALHIKYLL
jgi:hypothetical protein